MSDNLSLKAAQFMQRDIRAHGDVVEGEAEVSAIIDRAVAAFSKDYASTADQSLLESDDFTPEMRVELEIDLADRRKFSQAIAGLKLGDEELRELNRLVGVLGGWTVQALVMDCQPNFNLQLIIDEPVSQPLRSATWHYVPEEPAD